MITAPCQYKPTKKAATTNQDSARYVPEAPSQQRLNSPITPSSRPAWTSGRPSFSPSSPSPHPKGTQSSPTAARVAFPSLATQSNGSTAPHDLNLTSLSGLIGTTVTLSTKTAQRYEGIVGSTSSQGDTTGVTLKDVKEISTPGAPLKVSLFIASTNIDTWSSHSSDAPRPSNGDSFRPNTDISLQKKSPGGRERKLQAWVPSSESSAPNDDDIFNLSGGSASGGAWDQFAVNEIKFGITTTFDEDLYTTKLDCNASDFKERERKAQKLANGNLSGATNNQHIAEERGLVVDDSSVNEEDKYSTVVHSQNTYIPPTARKDAVSGALSLLSAPSKVPSTAAEVPKVSVNGPDSAVLQASPASSKAALPAPPASTSTTTASANKPPVDPLPAFRDFVTRERQRLTQKSQLNKPIPEDLVPILAKDKAATASSAKTIPPFWGARAAAGGDNEEAEQPANSSSNNNNNANAASSSNGPASTEPPHNSDPSQDAGDVQNVDREEATTIFEIQGDNDVRLQAAEDDNNWADPKPSHLADDVPYTGGMFHGSHNFNMDSPVLIESVTSTQTIGQVANIINSGNHICNNIDNVNGNVIPGYITAGASVVTAGAALAIASSVIYKESQSTLVVNVGNPKMMSCGESKLVQELEERSPISLNDFAATAVLIECLRHYKYDRTHDN